MVGPEDRQEGSPVLKFGEIYKSPEWESLPGIDRAQIMVVAEGLKPGATVLNNSPTLFKILAKMGISHVISSPYGIDVVFFAEERLLHEYSERIAGPGDDPSKYDRAMGEFLGIPACCIDEFCQRQKRSAEAGYFLMPEFHREIGDEIRNTGQYPDEFNYCIPFFSPCGIHCENATRLLAQWRNTIQAGDPDADEAVRFMNQEDYRRHYRY